jgi:apolipoprotein N-acyltransferase
MKILRQISLYTATGLLLALSYPPFPLFFLAYIALIPLIALALKNEKGFYYKVWTNFAIYHTITLWWIGSFQIDTDPFLLASGLALCVIHPFFFMLPFWLFRRIDKKIGRPIAILVFPLIWAVFEWWHSLGELGFPWLSLGYTQIYNKYWIQIADIVGTYGISFLIVWINIAVASLYNYFRKDFNLKDTLFAKENRTKLILLALCILVPNIYGLQIFKKYDDSKIMLENPNLKIGIVQPNINPWDKWRMNSFELLNQHLILQDSLVKLKGKQDLVLWSETSTRYLDYDVNFKLNFQFLKSYLVQNQSPILTGFTYYKLYKNGETPSILARKDDFGNYYVSLNSSILLNLDNNNNVRYDIYSKMKLTPFGERIPYVEDFGFLKDFFTWGVGISSWGYGKVQKNLRLENTEFGNIICIESVHPSFVRNFANQGAEFFTLITNDAWYDGTYGPYQHWLIAAMRSIENKRYTVRSANSGISGLITALGESKLMLPQYKTEIASVAVPTLSKAKYSTFYTEFGDVIVYLGLIILVPITLLTFMKVKGINIKG